MLGGNKLFFFSFRVLPNKRKNLSISTKTRVPLLGFFPQKKKTKKNLQSVCGLN